MSAGFKNFREFSLRLSHATSRNMLYSDPQTNTQGCTYKDAYCSFSCYSEKPESTHYLTTTEWFCAFWDILRNSMKSTQRMEVICLQFYKHAMSFLPSTLCTSCSLSEFSIPHLRFHLQGFLSPIAVRCLPAECLELTLKHTGLCGNCSRMC